MASTSLRAAFAVFALGASTIAGVSGVSPATAAGRGAEIAFVANSTKLGAGDATLVKHFAADGANVSVVDDDTLAKVDLSNIDLVVIAPSVHPKTVRDQFADLPIPVVLTHHQLLDDMGMTIGTIRSHQVTSIGISSPKHPLAAGLHGTVRLSTKATSLGSATPAASADIIATIAKRPALFMYEAGDRLADGSTASAARVFFPGSVTTASLASDSYFQLLGATIAVTLNATSNLPPDAVGDTYVTDEDTPLEIGTRLSPMYLLEGGESDGINEFDEALAVAFDADGDIVIADTDNDRIQTCHITGTWCSAFGSFGQLPGSFDRPSDVAVTDGGDIVVSDQGNHRIQICDRNGIWCRVIGEHGNGPGQFDDPFGIDIDAAGNIVVADDSNARVQTCEPASGTCTSFGSFATPASLPGHLSDPAGVAVLPNGDLLVSEENNDRVLRCTADGSTCEYFSRPDMNVSYPLLLSVGPNGDVLMTSPNAAGFVLCNEARTDCQQHFLWDDGDDTNAGLGEFNYPYDIEQRDDGIIAVTDPYDSLIHLFSPGGLLHNDTDPDGDTLTVVRVDTGAHSVGVPVETMLGATVTVQSDGSFVYDPTTSDVFAALPADVYVDDSFNYRISDGHGGEDTAVVTISVAGRDEGTREPVITTVGGLNTNTIRAAGHLGVLIDVDAFDDLDSDGNGLTWTLSTFRDGDLFSIDGRGQIRFHPPLPFLSSIDQDTDGIYDISVSVTDSNGGRDSQWFNIHIPTP